MLIVTDAFPWLAWSKLNLFLVSFIMHHFFLNIHVSKFDFMYLFNELYFVWSRIPLKNTDAYHDGVYYVKKKKIINKWINK